MKRVQFKSIITSLALILAWGLTAPPAHGATIIQAPGSSYVSFEAEGNPTVINGTPTVWVSTNDATASGGAALYIGGTSDNNTAPHSFAQYQIKLATAGTYNLYFRWRADPARTGSDVFTANSFFIGNVFGNFSTPGVDGRVDFTQTSIANGTQAPANNTYDWTSEAATFTVTAEQVAAGVPLVLSIGTREAGFTLDRLVFSTEAALSDAALDALGNSDTSIIVQGATETFVAFEAETKVNTINGTPTVWVSTNDATASAGAALYIGGTSDNNTAPHSFAQYQIKFAAAGTYNLYFRWRADPARTGSDVFTANSFFIGNVFGNFSTPGVDGRVDFTQTSTANGTQAPANNTYDWISEAGTFTVTAEQVAAGVPLVLSIGTREAGFTLDRLVFSPETGLSDAALDALLNSGSGVVLPKITKAEGSAALNTVLLIFNKTLAAGSVSASKFTLSGGVAVNGATLDSTDPRRVTLTTAAQTPGTVYTLTVTGVTDTSGVAVGPNTTKNFSAWKLVEGWATTEIYMGVAGATVADLTASVGYQARTPNELRWVKGFQLNNNPRGPNYGVRLSAFFTPGAAGVHNFYVNNDDEAELFLSSDQSEANLSSLGLFPLSPQVFDDNIFAPSPSLAVGQKYLLVGLLQQSGGDVYLNVAAQPVAGAVPAAGLPVLGGNRISTYVNPDLGNVTFNQQPEPATAAVGDRARFSVNVTTTENPVYYQWRVGGVDIPGATRSVYQTPILSAGDNGKVYSVVVSVAGKDTPSGTAVLTVQGTSTSNLQPYIGINFTGSGNDSVPGRLTGVDVAGVVLQENWNNLSGFDFADVALQDASGASTPVRFTALASEQWYTGTIAVGGANGVLMHGFINTAASLEPFLMTLNNVPAGNYNLLVYSAGFPFSASYETDFSVTGVGSYPTYHVKSETGLEFNAAPAFRRMTSTDPNNRGPLGNYVQFDKISPAADGSLVISATWASANAGNGHQPALNGIQLVKVSNIVVPPVRPTLSVLRNGNNATISWTADAVGFVLESSAAVTGSAWTLVAGSPNPIAGAGSVSVGAADAARFYLLRKP